jgi:Zn-dependent protease with chaperone function
LNEDRAARYHRLRRRAVIATTFAGCAWLSGFTATGASLWLAQAAARATAGWAWPLGRAASIALFVVLLGIGYEVVSLPLIFFRSFLLERKYGLSTERLLTWAVDHAKALVLGMALSVIAAEAMYGSMHVAGRWWWALCAGLFALAGIAIANVAPILLMPLFYRFRPLDRSDLRERLMALSARARVPVLGVFEWGLGDKTSRANAALVGLGRTRRILLSDTLLKEYSDDEIEVILAHEMAHHVHHDIWTSLALDSGVTTSALLVAQLSIGTPGDLASLPLVVLVAGAASMVLTPIVNAWSRRNERRADRFALGLTRMPDAFVSAMRRLGVQNLAEERPSRAVVWFFHTHPTMDERVHAARTFQLR